MRNTLIYAAAIGGEKPADLARKYKISPTRIAQIIHRQAKRNAPKLYKELSLGCGKPRLEDFRQNADRFLHGDA